MSPHFLYVTCSASPSHKDKDLLSCQGQSWGVTSPRLPAWQALWMEPSPCSLYCFLEMGSPQHSALATNISLHFNPTELALLTLRTWYKAQLFSFQMNESDILKARPATASSWKTVMTHRKDKDWVSILRRPLIPSLTLIWSHDGTAEKSPRLWKVIKFLSGL